MLLVIALVCAIYARCQQTLRTTAFYAEWSDLATNYWKYKKRNLTNEELQDRSFTHGTDKSCWYHPIYFNDDTGFVLIQGAQPSKRYNHLDELVKTHEIKTIFNLAEVREDQPSAFNTPITREEWRKKTKVDVIELPIKDYKLPTLNELKGVVPKIQEALQLGNVYLHCKSGVGRSSCITLAFFSIVYPDWSFGKLKSTLLDRRGSSNIDKPLMNRLLWELISKKPGNEDYTIEQEIQKRRSELPDLSDETANELIKDEYRGIECIDDLVDKVVQVTET